MALLHGKYELLSPIASGGMASVHLGRVVGMGGFERLVAIKKMHPHLLAEKEYITMFLDEARLAARIRHPNVVATLDVAESDDGPFIVMEFIEGPTLSQLLKVYRKSDGVMPLDVALGIFCDTLDGLHAAHELVGSDRQPLKLVHRDVSPQNIMVGRDGVSRITDFGVAKANVRLSSTRSGFLKGKLAYLAPEQVRGEEIDRRADVYAAGVVLWEMLTSQRLFRADTEANLMWQLMQGAEKSPREVHPEVPEAIDAVCMKALAMATDDRFASCADFVAAVEKAAIDSGVQVAKARRVSRLVEELDLPTPAASVPPPDRTAQTVSSPAVAESSAPGAASVRTEAAVASPVVEPKRGRGGLVVGALAVFALGVGAAFLVMGGRDGGDATDAAAADAATTTESDTPVGSQEVASPAPTAGPATGATSAASAESTASAASTATAVASSAPTASVAAPPPAVAPRPWTKPPAPPAAAPPPAPAGPNADYQPEGL